MSDERWRDTYDSWKLMSDRDEFPDDEPEPYEYEEDDPRDECGLMVGQCMSAGTEHCDFVCPFRVQA